MAGSTAQDLETAHRATADAATVDAEQEAVAFTQRLIRFDTRNNGDGTCNERPAAEWAAEQLAQVGISSSIIESELGRANLVAQIEGEDPSLPALLVHGHLDTVPANEDDWSVDPLGGDIHNDDALPYVLPCVWGRGAVDMKDMVAMLLAAVRSLSRSGTRPHRTIKLVLFADEEAGGFKGSEWLVVSHPEIFEDVGFIISETGGFSDYVNGQRVYYVQTGEKGTQWFSLQAEGTQSHGSQINPDNAVVSVARSAVSIAEYQWPVDLNPVTELLLSRLSDITGIALDSANAVQRLIDATGFAGAWIASSVRNTFNVTSIDAGSTVNIIPANASALVDGRALPGREDALMDTLQRLTAGSSHVNVIHRSKGYLCDPGGTLFTAIESVLHEVDPQTKVLPFLSSGGTDSKAVLSLNPDIEVCGFIPLQIPEGFNYIANFHGIDEHVPVDALRFGERTLERFIATF
ncbi:M20/M25/M40 family metallo-hydrolase [Bifidobacterium tibiigranuli]|jgi:acetylornithine deacetylase/succinyl-diaminopimelate desuccinylase-like protein|uniref:M20/M25/M40 family metallo-hydrolase n=1 Tax=Bifidobacterium tibiigranuli TaxID=2172043 RepID=UPI0026E9FB21|nr:M20/M25/M40 family metallo-hydrolase [Bifidobacterium tibiigranuli]MCI1650196.1 M20/M25/M40 family metallo-hydrolase [Bifidobacterium tibiigranuli]MCI1673899.1 M20/M25/M40 family metallo-hydrolase [Bifidobacterium tibiigranuli]MCI1712148.1 M20/M25/M40 family metallo-hydrolase [Bifidobacterium tibiigranuli]MCI1834260.1 M20/M25/M40 family metallo-hydrolase [Bifidobacterium tibiigranuli]MCI2185754.1 M20/M25/M40 family metallo-hydrolase [Bifidobacterium tibiigranuli]